MIIFTIMKTIIVRLNAEDELFVIIERVAKKLSMTFAGLAKLALYKFCSNLNLTENGKPI